MTQTFWNFDPTPCRKVRVEVGKSPRSTWWCASLEGQARDAVEVNYHGDIFYLDNEDGSGWAKVTQGRGGPDWGHNSLPVTRVLPAILPGLPGGPPYEPTSTAPVDRSGEAGETREAGLDPEGESAVTPKAAGAQSIAEPSKDNHHG